MDASRYLNKSKILAGQQCALRLWLSSFAPESAAPRDPAVNAIRESGREIGARARLLFPGGVLVDVEDFDRARARTRSLADDPAVPAIFEAAFVHDGVRIRVDVLERVGAGAWGLREVKATARVKDKHLDDAAIQRYVLEGAGLHVSSVEVIHVDNRYVRGDEIEWPLFFNRADVTAAVADRTSRLPLVVRELRQHLTAPARPIVEPSAHCWTPRGCEFWAHCTREKPADWIFHLPRLRAARKEALRAAGVERITDIPDDVELGALPARIRDVLRSGRAFVSSDLAAALATFGPPTYYLDFETMNPAIPVYPGTRPFEQIAAQWSLHRLGAERGLEHQEFLADGRGDPRRELAETLLAAVGASADPIVVYSSFESSVLNDLASAFPDLAPALQAIRTRLRDLSAVVQTHVYDPAFDYSFSLKSVAPALAPDFGYGGLDEIADGRDASRAFTRLTAQCSPQEASRIRRALLAYCERDTRALVELHRALRGLGR